MQLILRHYYFWNVLSYEWYELLYQNHSSRLKTFSLKNVAVFIVELSFQRESYTLLAGWCNRDGSLVDALSLYFHHKTSKLYAMLGRFDCVVSPLSLLRFEHLYAVLWSSIFLIEKRRTLLIRLKHNPSVFWLITNSSISFLSSSTHFSRSLITASSVSFYLLLLFFIFYLFRSHK